MTGTNKRAALIASIEESNRALLTSLGRLQAVEILGIGVSMAQVKALYLLGDGEGLHLSQLAASLGVTLSTASTSVERLVETGLASRTEDPFDRRQVVIRRTPAGDAVLDRLHALSHPLLLRLLETLTDVDLEIVERASGIMAGAAVRLAAAGNAAPEDGAA